MQDNLELAKIKNELIKRIGVDFDNKYYNIFILYIISYTNIIFSKS